MYDVETKVFDEKKEVENAKESDIMLNNILNKYKDGNMGGR